MADETGGPATGHGPMDPILLRVAFASARHAHTALVTIAQSRDLFDSAEINECVLPYCDLVLLDVHTRHSDRSRVVTLVQGLHGVVVGIGNRALAACAPKRRHQLS